MEVESPEKRSRIEAGEENGPQAEEEFAQAEAEEEMWDEIFKITSPEREDAIRKGRRLMLKK